MSLSDLASLGSFVSGVAVVVTLIFLLFQMQQSTRNQKSLMQQGRSARLMNTILVRANPHLAEAVARALSGDITIDATQLDSLKAWIASIFFSFEDSYLQYQAGTLDRTVWDTELTSLRSIVSVPMMRVEWKSFLRGMMTGGYRDFIDELMRQMPAARPIDARAIWQKLMAEEIAASV